MQNLFLFQMYITASKQFYAAGLMQKNARCSSFVQTLGTRKSGELKKKTHKTKMCACIVITATICFLQQT